MSEHLTVSRLAAQVGVSPDAVRYYERLGLPPPPARSAAGYRRYDEGALDRLRFVKGAQRVGLRLREIAELLQVADRGQCPCGHTETLLRERLAMVDAEHTARAAARPDRGLLASRTTAASWASGRLAILPVVFDV